MSAEREQDPRSVPPANGRRPEDVIASALGNADLMRQLEESIESERRGEPAVPWRQIQAELRARQQR